MAKIRSVEELDDAISTDTVWRKRELTTALKFVQQSKGAAQAASIRAGVLILYAHWEGWVKSVAQLYVRYVNSQRLAYEQLSDAFLGNALKVKIGLIDQASVAEVHNEFATFLRQGMDGHALLSEDLVQTQSNLSSKVFADIVVRLGVPRRPEYSMQAELIDERLVNKRNNIAHGRFLEVKPEDYLELHDRVLKLLDLFTDDIRNAASMGSYATRSD